MERYPSQESAHSKKRKKKKKKHRDHHSKKKSKKVKEDSNQLRDASEEVSRQPAADLDISPGDYSHQQCMDLVRSHLNSLLNQDPLLCDLPKEITLEEVKSFIALENGQAMRIIIKKEDGSSYGVIVQSKATVRDLKKAVERATTLKLSRESDSRNVSWRYIWKTYWLSFNGQKLKDDGQLLRYYDMENKSQVSFVKRLNDK